MKKTLLLLPLWFSLQGAAYGAVDEAVPTVLHVVASPAGQAPSEYDILLSAEPDIFCREGKMTVTFAAASSAEGTATLTFAAEDSVQLSLKSAEEVGIRRPAEALPHPIFDLTAPGRVRIKGLERGALVQACGADGRLAAQTRAGADGTALLDISRQGRGVFVVRVNQRQTFKLLKP